MRHFVVVSQQRSGSHMLMNMLNSHPAVHCNSDLMTEDVRAHGAEWAFAEGLRLPPKYPERSPLPPGKAPEIVGFLVKMKQDLHRHFREHSELKFILLQRRNRLATLLSYIVSGKLGTYPDPKDGISLRQAAARREKLKPQRISPGEAEAFFEKWAAMTEEVERCLEGADWLRVAYEDLMSEPERTMRAVYGHLEVPWHDIGFGPGWGGLKLDPRPLDEAIRNYRELKEYFSGTPWESFFTAGR